MSVQHLAHERPFLNADTQLIMSVRYGSSAQFVQGLYVSVLVLVYKQGKNFKKTLLKNVSASEVCFLRNECVPTTVHIVFQGVICPQQLETDSLEMSFTHLSLPSSLFSI